MRLLKLATDRLELVAATLEHVGAEIKSAELLGSMLDARVGPGWPPGEYDRPAQAFFQDKLREGGRDVIGWYGWYVIQRGDPQLGDSLVGAGGFLGPPNEHGEVEIGVSILPMFEGRGFATEVVKALVSHAFTDARVLKVIAHTTPGNLASRRVIEKSGLHCVGNGADSGSIRFELARVPPSS